MNERHQHPSPLQLRRRPASSVRGPTHSQTVISALRRWDELWNLDGLTEEITVRFSQRLRSAWGRAYVQRKLVTLHHALRCGSRSKLEEVLCHEIAHLAVFLRSGGNARPHGKEWAELVRKAGFEPKVRMAAPQMARRQALGRTSPQPVPSWEHRCPVCQTVRFGRRPIRGWRCAQCVASGLDGLLEITRVR